MRRNILTLALLALMGSACALAQAPVIGSTVNATVGYQLGGNAPNAHTLCGNGTVYVDSATPCTALTLFYQTVQANGSAQTQEPALNFSSFFAVTTSGGASNVDPTHVGANKTCANPTTMTVDVYGRTTACTAGGASSVLLSQNGYEVYPSGHIHEWGLAADAAGSSISVTFPLAFPHAVFSVVATDSFAGSSRIVSVSSFSTSSFTINNDGTSNGEYWEADGW